MRRGIGRALPLLAALLLVPALASAQTEQKNAQATQKKAPAAQRSGSGLNLGRDESGKPISIEADQGIEWRQTSRVYIARGNAKATRGNVTVYADELIAYYRPVTKQPGKPVSPADTGEDPSGGTEIYRVEADGHVRIATETQNLVGDHGVYDVDKATMIMTGKNLKLTTPRDVVTARDSLEWYDRQQIAVARGDAVAVRDQKRVRADVLTAAVARDKNGAQHVSRVDAQGNVVVSSQSEIGHSDSGVYNADTGIVTLVGHVRLTRAQNELRGQYAVVDLNKNVSRLLSQPPSTHLTGGPAPRVEGLIMPRQQPPPVFATTPPAKKE